MEMWNFEEMYYKDETERFIIPQPGRKTVTF